MIMSKMLNELVALDIERVARAAFAFNCPEGNPDEMSYLVDGAPQPAWSIYKRSACQFLVCHYAIGEFVDRLEELVRSEASR